MPDPNEELTPEQQAAKDQQQQQAQAQQQAQMEMQQRQILAQIGLIEGKAKEAMAKGDKADLDKMLTRLKALRESMEIAGSVGANPQLAAAADEIMRDVTGVNNVPPGLPAG